MSFKRAKNKQKLSTDSDGLPKWQEQQFYSLTMLLM
jgi:hypothetical protein